MTKTIEEMLDELDIEDTIKNKLEHKQLRCNYC